MTHRIKATIWGIITILIGLLGLVTGAIIVPDLFVGLGILMIVLNWNVKND